MSITLPPLPHPVMNAMLGDDWADLFTADQMHAHAAAVSAAKDAEIAGLRAELIKSLADNAALRADAIDRQNNDVAPLRERVRELTTQAMFNPQLSGAEGVRLSERLGGTR